MVELAVEHEAGMAVCREEIDRDGVIYTVDTLAALKRKMPDCTLTYLIGAGYAARAGHVAARGDRSSSDANFW